MQLGNDEKRPSHMTDMPHATVQDLRESGPTNATALRQTGECPAAKGPEGTPISSEMSELQTSSNEARDPSDTILARPSSLSYVREDKPSSQNKTGETSMYHNLLIREPQPSGLSNERTAVPYGDSYAATRSGVRKRSPDGDRSVSRPCSPQSGAAA